MAKLGLVSIVVPGLNEAQCLPQLYAELTRVCDDLPYDFEFLFVDDGSTDATVEGLADLRRRDERVRYLVLSRNFGHQAALSAGLAHAAGDAVIMMDGDLQHPPAVIPLLIERWRDGYDVVNTIRVETAQIHPLKKLWSDLFYKAFNWLGSIKIQPGGADFRLMSRLALDALNQLPERHRFLRGLVPWLGFRQTQVEFKAELRWAGHSKFTFLRNIKFALDGLTSFSFYPLRRLTMFGYVIMLASFGYALWALGAHFLTDATVPGWTSLMICVLFFGGCQLMAFGVLGEYIGRILEQVKGRPLYLVQQACGVGAAIPVERCAPVSPSRQLLDVAFHENGQSLCHHS